MYVAVSTCLASLAGGLGALSAGVILSSLHDIHFAVGGLSFAGFHVLFAGSMTLRLCSTVFLASRIPD